MLFRRYSGLDRSGVRLIVEDDAGAPAGWGRLQWWDEADGTRLYLLSGAVPAARRRQGIGRALLSRLEEEATSLWRADPGPGPALLGGNADPDEPATLALLQAAGYRVRFTVVGLAREADPAATAELPPGVELRPVELGHHPAIYAAIQECFDHSGLGQMPFSYAEYLEDIQDPALWMVAWDSDGVAAVTISEMIETGVADTPWVAVRPDRRRQGLASALLRRNLALLAAHGVREARIRTVQENPNHTVSGYERLGYRITERTPRYSKPLGS